MFARKLHSTLKPTKLYSCATNTKIEQLLKNVNRLKPEWIRSNSIIDRISLVGLLKSKLTWSSNAIRNNTISYQDVVYMNKTGRTMSDLPLQQIEEITHHNRAVTYVFEKIKYNPISPQVIQSIHSLLVPKSELV